MDIVFSNCAPNPKDKDWRVIGWGRAPAVPSARCVNEEEEEEEEREGEKR